LLFISHSYFLIYYQDEPRNDNDLASVRIASTCTTSDTRKITHRPTTNFKADWGGKKLDSLKDYLSTNARTKDGRSYIAKTNNVSEEWEVILKTSPENTPVTTLCYKLAVLVAENTTRKERLVFGSTEGFHRCLASIQALVGSKIDGQTGVIEGPGLLSYDDFAKNDILIPEDVHSRYPKLQDLIQYVHINKCQYFDTPSTVEVRYLSSSAHVISTSKMLSILRDFSAQISTNKKTSAANSAFVQIGNYGRRMIENIPDLNITHRPNTKRKTPINRTTFKTVNEAKKEMKKAEENSVLFAYPPNVEQMAFKSNPYSFTEDYENFAQDPNNIQFQKKVLDFYTYPAHDATEVRLSPPFLNTTLGFLGEKAITISTWAINAAWFIPFICHFIWADLKNVPIATCIGDQGLKQLVLYIVRYHSNAIGLTTLKIHGAKYLYDKISATLNTTNDPNDIIGAVLLTSDIINVGLTHPDEWARKILPGLDSRREQLKRVATIVDVFYSTIKNRHKLAQDKDIVLNLCKCKY
jgi:hypothetical protein